MKQFDSDPDIVVACNVCALDDTIKEFQRRAMPGHVGGAHGKRKRPQDPWTVARYKQMWPNADHFAMYKPSVEARKASSDRLVEINKRKREDAGTVQPVAEESTAAPAPVVTFSSDDTLLNLLLDSNRKLLTPDEQKFYQSVYESLLQAVDRDEIQMPIISSLAYDMIVLRRLRESQLKSTKNNGIPLKPTEDAIKACETRIRSQMDKLGISREQQLKNNETLKSTPASIISGYLDEVARMSPQSLKALELEEKRVLARMKPRIEELILSEAPDVPKETADEKDDDSHLTLNDALKRAGMGAFRGSAPPPSPTEDDDLPF